MDAQIKALLKLRVRSATFFEKNAQIARRQRNEARYIAADESQATVIKPPRPSGLVPPYRCAHRGRFAHPRPSEFPCRPRRTGRRSWEVRSYSKGVMLGGPNGTESPLKGNQLFKRWLQLTSGAIGVGAFPRPVDCRLKKNFVELTQFLPLFSAGQTHGSCR